MARVVIIRFCVDAKSVDVVVIALALRYAARQVPCVEAIPPPTGTVMESSRF
jgi:hypothetical protein